MLLYLFLQTICKKNSNLYWTIEDGERGLTCKLQHKYMLPHRNQLCKRGEKMLTELIYQGQVLAKKQGLKLVGVTIIERLDESRSIFFHFSKEGVVLK